MAEGDGGHEKGGHYAPLFISNYATIPRVTVPLSSAPTEPTKSSPWQGASLYSRLMFSWVTPLLERGLLAPHRFDTLLDTPLRDRARKTSGEFLERCARYRSRPVLRTLVALHWRSMAFVISMVIFHIVCQTFSPFLLRSLVNSLNAADVVRSAADPLIAALSSYTTHVSSVIALLMFFSTVGMVVSIQHAFMNALRIASRIKSQLIVVIYEKSLRLTRIAKQTTPNGKILNMLGSDVDRVHYLIPFLHSPFAHPIQIVLVLWLLYSMIGWAAFVGAGTMAAMLSLSVVLARFNVYLRKKLLKITDRRISILNEIFTHIRVIKFYAWEKSFLNEVGKLRDAEVRFLSKIALVLVGINSVFQAAPVLVAAATFTTLAYLGTVPSVGDLLAAIGLFALLRWSMTILPEAIVSLLESNISVRRIEEFLALPEQKPVERDEQLPRGTVRFSDWSADWSPGVSAIDKLSLKIDPGELVCIVGRIGSGKSALLMAVLGELEGRAGKVGLNGSIGYVAQHPWIVNDSLRHNITLGRQLDRARYERCLIAAALEPDLALLPNGDATEIGERGINLSGGQKQRISLARAAYTDSDIYVLDDPVSALDPAVAEEVFSELILGDLQGKTRILATHRLEFAERADRIIFMDQGRIVEIGTPKELAREGSAYHSLKASYVTEAPTYQEKSSETVEPSGSVESGTANEETAEQDLVAGSLIVEEERKTGSVARAMYKRYLTAFASGGLVIVILALFLTKDGVSIATDTWLSWWANGKIPEMNTFLQGYVALGLTLIVLSFLRAFLVRMRGLRAGTVLHQDLLRGVLRAPLRFFDTNPVGRIISRFSGDINTVDLSVPLAVTEVLSSAAGLLSALTLIVVVNPILAVGIIPLGYVYYRYQQEFRPTSRECQRLDSISRSPIFAKSSESLNGLATIRAFGWGGIFRERMLTAVDENQRCFFGWIAANRWLGLRLELLGACIVLAAALSPTIIPSYLGATGAGLAVLYALAVTGALNWFIRMLTQMESNMNSVERIDFYSSVESERWDGEIPPPQWPESGRIEFRNVEVRYRSDGQAALSGLTAIINSGERIGIAGRTGAGKSTLVLALSRLIELSAGEILIDDTPIAKLALADLRAAIAVIPQDPVMFLGTVRSNLDPFSQFSDDDIWQALERTHIAPFIRTLPGALSATVHEGGSNFSAGQRQLICLTRALLRNNKIIILDEATANVDAETDSLLQQTIRKEFAGKTILTIAHRLATILDYDRILVLDQGRVAEFGPVTEILRRGEDAGLQPVP